MIADRRTLDSLRAGACQARVVGDYARAARLERQAVERAEALGWIGERTRALLWEGYSLRQAGEDDLALAALLQAAGERAATADPADVFSALIAIVHISLDHKSVAFCRVVLDQGRRLLAELRQPWSGPLDFLEGELALRRGDFTAAWNWHSRAWVGWRDEHPRLTAPTHLWALCRVAFRRRATDELARLTETLAELRPAQALERQLVQRARLLDWRARRALALGDAAPVEPALDLLAATEKGEGAAPISVRAGRHCECWHWRDTGEIDAALARRPLDGERFDDALLLGDLALGRARAALEGPAVDDDYGEPANGGSASSFVLTGEALRAAERHYRAVLPLAEAEDERLETEWHGATVRERLWRI